MGEKSLSSEICYEKFCWTYFSCSTKEGEETDCEFCDCLQVQIITYFPLATKTFLSQFAALAPAPKYSMYSTFVLGWPHNEPSKFSCIIICYFWLLEDSNAFALYSLFWLDFENKLFLNCFLWESYTNSGSPSHWLNRLDTARTTATVRYLLWEMYTMQYLNLMNGPGIDVYFPMKLAYFCTFLPICSEPLLHSGKVVAKKEM